jgi:uncharacterized protein YndB with AHSA1/START domain
MIMLTTVFKKDLDNKRIIVNREFAGSLSDVWRAWTEPELLDQWWAPKPWHAKTKSMDFRPGGSWLYSMIGPEGEEHFARADYHSISREKSFEVSDCFCDDQGKIDKNLPTMEWNTRFSGAADHTKVDVEITFNSVEDLEKILAMGFEEGFTAAHTNLDELLSRVTA